MNEPVFHTEVLQPYIYSSIAGEKFIGNVGSPIAIAAVAFKVTRTQM